MSNQLNELRLLYLRDNLVKLEDSLLELQKALAELAAKPAMPHGDGSAAEGDEEGPGDGLTMYTATTFEAVMRAIPPDSTIDSIERRDEGWIVKVSDH